MKSAHDKYGEFKAAARRQRRFWSTTGRYDQAKLRELASAYQRKLEALPFDIVRLVSINERGQRVAEDLRIPRVRGPVGVVTPQSSTKFRSLDRMQFIVGQVETHFGEPLVIRYLDEPGTPIQATVG